MFEQIKEQLKEIAEISDGCPSQYRERCFSILLEHYLSSVEKIPDEKPSGISPVTTVGKLLEGVSDDVVSSIFHIEKDKCNIIVRDLKVRPKAKKQVRLALLLGMKNKMETGTRLIFREELRQICSQYSGSDINLNRNIKRCKDLFIEKGEGWELTIPGENEAIKLMKELAGVGEQK